MSVGQKRSQSLEHLSRSFDVHNDLGIDNQINREVALMKATLPPPIDKQLFKHKIFTCFQWDDVFQELTERVASYISKCLHEEAYYAGVDTTLSPAKSRPSIDLNPAETIKGMQKRINVLQERLERQTRDYYQELLAYRLNHRRQQTAALARIKDSDFLKSSFELRLFDETEYLLTPE